MRRLAPLLVLLPAAALVAGACGNDKLRRAGETVEAVSGNPAVGQGLPGVDRLDGGADSGVFGSAAPFQVDQFDQQQVSKVDILWVISDSGAMKAKQERVKANFVAFMYFLQQQKTDFHLGVVAADVYDSRQSGRLVNAAGLPVPWIDANTPNPAVAFLANASVGTGGSYDIKPLFAGMLSLTPPFSPVTPDSPDAGAANCANTASGPQCFLRPDAPLYVVILADHEDNSCAPIAATTEGCYNAAATLNGYGAIEYWTRFYSGAKGAGGSVKVSAIVATESTHYECAAVFAHLCDPYNISTACGGAAPNCNIGSSNDPCCSSLRACYNELVLRAPYCRFAIVTDAAGAHAAAPYYQISSYIDGCVSAAADGGVADFAAWGAQRTTAVALATGGVATSICESDYTPALARLGLQAAGLRSDFPLSRAPVPSSLVVQVAGAAMPPPAAGWICPPSNLSPQPPVCYLGCENPPPPGPLPHPPANVLRFAAPPAAGAKVSVSYNVNVRGLGACP